MPNFKLDSREDGLIEKYSPQVWNSKYDPKKENLILLHSFPTNSILLRGLGNYLGDYFNLYFLDLPGFVDQIPPLKEVSVENYVSYVQDQIIELDLENYFIGGISFGFLIANKIADNDNCLGVLAMEPFLNINQTKVSRSKQFFSNNFIKLISLTSSYNFVWNNSLFRFFLYLGNSREQITLLFKTVDPKTFFKTGKLLLDYNEKIIFKNKPYVLLINQEDQTIDAQAIVEEFKKNIKKLLVINTTIEHYPKNLLKVYFENHVAKKDIQSVLDFLAK